MEQARLFTAIVLSFIVLFAWNYFFVDQEPIQKTAVEAPIEPSTTQTTPKETAAPSDRTQQDSNTGVMSGESELSVNEPLSDQQHHSLITISTPLYSVVLSSQGAVVKSMTLNNYRESVEPDAPLKEMVSPDLTHGTVQFELADKSISNLSDAVFTTSAVSDRIEVSNKPGRLSFKWRSPEGVIVEKTYTFKPDSYLIGYNLALYNQSDRILQDELIVSLVSKAPEGKRMYGFEGPFALIDDHVKKIKLKKIEDKNIYTGDLNWVAFTDRYFMSSVIPADPQKAKMRLSLDDNIVKTRYQRPTGTLTPGISRSYDFQLYMGPKSLSVLKNQGYDLKKAVDFGFFDFLAKPCLLLMNFIHSVIPNYGIAIIILTILIKIVFWPLGTKSYLSMNEMKKLQPLMAEIREKHKNDKQKMNAEIMNLYKTYKVNPVSGCLPIIVQMPIFFALYRMLYEAIELRHAPFVGWINDLSAPDRLLNFDVAIPFMQPPYGIPVLTIVMGATMFLQQKLSPQAGDPAQAKMMMFMPLIFTVIFINFSSGLVLYWLVNNILSIAQQYYVVKRNA